MTTTTPQTDTDRGFDVCVGCGADIANPDVAYGLPDDGFLCYVCAMKRGGAYDPVDDRWVTAPSLEGLGVAVS